MTAKIRQLIPVTATSVPAVFAAVGAEVRVRRGWTMTDDEITALALELGVRKRTVADIQHRYLASNAEYYPDDMCDRECGECHRPIPARKGLEVDYMEWNCPACGNEQGWEGWFAREDFFEKNCHSSCSMIIHAWQRVQDFRARCPDAICTLCHKNPVKPDLN